MNETSATDAAAPGRSPELLWEDGERRFCRVWRPGVDSFSQLCLAVLPAKTSQSVALAERLAREYALKDCLDDAWALRPVALLEEGGRSGFLCEYREAEPLDRLLASSMDMERFLRLAIALAGTLARLHESGLVHKDIKPANILVDAAGERVWFTGFGVASRLPREHQTPEPPELIAGTLSHMAPEQTGRMNRSIDSRSDLYSLGVTLYQTLTGRLPFLASDAMEWVHCHIARMPPAPGGLVPGVPAQVSAIVMRLLAKTPEERYQTAAGVERDLGRCLHAWQTTRDIADFPLGERDRSDRLVIPEQLYGRENEVDALLAAFDRVVGQAGRGLVLVRGQAGIGKSSVVNELHKVLVAPRGWFAVGKFDQLKSDVPYAPVAQAFQGLIRGLLAKSDEELGEWRGALREGLDVDAPLAVALIPELRFILGEQLPVPDMDPLVAKLRWQRALRRVIGVFARREHPLALFLDDLQWLDGATLDLLEGALLDQELGHLLVVGAFRDSEVDATHPLARKVTAIRAAGVAVQEIFLGPLGHEDLERLVAGALQCDGAWAQPLAQLVHEKTAGNPLFTNQFIQALADEGLIAFDRRDERWSWDLQPIRAKALTGNVVEMVLRKMGRLPAHTLRALEDLACLGNRAATGTLALAHGTSEEDLHADLWEALHRELVVRSPDGYRFVHDRVQEAAYRLIPEATRPQAHLRIGRALAAGLASEQRDESLFDIVGQLNRGASLLHAPEERLELVELDLGAARRAMSTAAHASARAYLEAAAALVGDEAWQRRPDLMFELELRRAECEFQTAEPARAIERLQALLPRAHNLAERAAATSQLVDIYLMVQRPDLGLGVGFACLAEAGFAVPGRPSAAEARSAYDRVLQRLGGRSIESLAQLPLSTDDGARGVLAVLAKMLSCAVVMDHALLCLLVSAGVELSLEHGNCDPSTFVYSYFGVVAAALYGDVEIGYRFGQLGRDLVAAGLRRFEGFVEGAFALHITPWSRPAGESRALVRECIVAAQRRADLIIFVTCGVAEFAIVLVNGDPLADVEAGCDRAVEQARRAGFPDFTQAATLQGALVRNLRGLTDRFGRLDDGHTSEAEIERYFAEQAHLPTIEAWYWIRKAQARYLAGEFQDAAEALDRALPLAWTCRITFEAAELAFYGALVHAAVWDGTPAEERPGHIEAVRAFHKQLETWARHCPANFANRATLAAAELARIESRDDDALQLYAEAARAARDSAFWHNEALVNELAARFHASRAREGQARELLRAARRAYQHWGADGKVRQLDEWQGASGEASSSADESRTVQTPVEQLDLAVVLQVLQAVSGETDLGRLISTVMRLALEQAGAARGLLILPRGNAHRVEAEAATYDTGVAVVLQPDDTTATALPQSVLQYVLRTNESVLLHEASGDLSFGDDAYLRTRPARSVLCMPLLKQARLVGVLYLENPLISHAFTPARLTLLKLLASEAAISLENARLYRDLQEREARVRRLVDANIIGIVLWHRDGRILEANDAFLRMVGYARTDVLSGRIRWADLSPPDWAHEDVRAMDTVRDVGEVQAFEREVLRKDGARVPVLVGAANFEGTPDEGVGFFVDLSENKRAEQAARESEMRLANANRVASIGHLAAAITHEINQPLAGIITNTSAGTRMLATDPADLPAIGETLRRTLRDAERASEVIRRLRSLFSSRDSVAEDVDLNEVAQSVAELMTADFRRERVSLALDLGQGLLPVLGDRVQLQQVVLNLLRNAAEATRDVEGRPREVLLRTARDGDDQVRLSVTDSGHGLDPSTRARLFEAFHTTKPDGMGIGLSVSHTIIERHQGTLRAEDNTGPGATFMFSLPTVPSDGQRAVE